MNRCFSAMNPQQAPRASWQALASGRQTAAMDPPAAAARLVAGPGVGPPNRVDERPVDERRYAFPQNQKQENAQGRARPVREQVFPQPLHRRAIRALYQFMNAEIERLMVRYTAMMMATPSIACPVWLMAVFAIETRSG